MSCIDTYLCGRRKFTASPSGSAYVWVSIASWLLFPGDRWHQSGVTDTVSHGVYGHMASGDMDTCTNVFP